MKTTLGVGISVLSALAAQGKDFDRAELNAMLDRLAASPEPKIEPQAIAMCYVVAGPKERSYEYHCPKCGRKTVYPPDVRDRRRYLQTLREGVVSLKSKGLNIELDESCLCRECGKGLKIPVEGEVVIHKPDSFEVGDRVKIFNAVGGEYGVEPIAECGWVCAKYITPEGVITGDDVNVRLHPDSRAIELSSLEQGEKVRILPGGTKHKGWVRIATDNLWIRASYVPKKLIGKLKTDIELKTVSHMRFDEFVWIINGRRVKAQSSDLELLSAFLDGKDVLVEESGVKTSLKRHLPRLKDLLGVPPVQVEVDI